VSGLLSEPVRDIEVAFDHRQTAHCETGVISSLLRNKGFEISEPMAFGASASLTFAYIPIVKFGGLPLFAYRMPPKAVIKGLCKRLGIQMAYETYRSPEAGMRALDEHLDAGRVVGLQTSVFWLDYFPPDMRFHFNAHNLVVYGRKGTKYLISDPVIDIRVECEAEALKQARFVRGALAPKGLLYYPTYLPEKPDWKKAIRSAIRYNTGMMLYTPLPFIGVRGIRHVAKLLRKLDPSNAKYNRLFIGHMVRMQEEIGTGGAGFRFLYASFLQEASGILDKPKLKEISAELVAAGDQWRAFALEAAKMCKGRAEMDLNGLSERLMNCAELESVVYKKLREEVK
jgi:hypothetical protein